MKTIPATEHNIKLGTKVMNKVGEAGTVVTPAIHPEYKTDSESLFKYSGKFAATIEFKNGAVQSYYLVDLYVIIQPLDNAQIKSIESLVSNLNNIGS